MRGNKTLKELYICIAENYPKEYQSIIDCIENTTLSDDFKTVEDMFCSKINKPEESPMVFRLESLILS